MRDDELKPPEDGDWIVVRNWDHYQTYRDRDPRWIKVYTKLLQDPDYLGLSFAAKGLLQIIWLAFSARNGLLSVSNLDRICRRRLSFAQLKALNHAGFIEWTKTQPPRARARAQETEVEKEKEKESSKSSYPKAQQILEQRALDYAADWQGGPSDVFEEHLDELERELHARLSYGQRSRLWDEAMKRDRRTKA